MNATALLDPHAVLTEPATLTLQRRLPASIERVWAYLTESPLRQQWLAAGTMTLQPGSAFELVWRNDELSTPPSPRPEGFSEEQRMNCQLTEVDPPHRLSFTWQGSGEVSFELAPDGDGVLLTVVHRRLPSRETMVMVGAGWHMHLDLLVAVTQGREKSPFWPGWARLRDTYAQRLGA